jgi:hypothetical protein
MKVIGIIPKTLLEACKKKDCFTSVENEGDDGDAKNNYWLYLKDGLIDSESGCHSIHECTVKDCLKRFGWIITEEEYFKKHKRE